MRGGIAGCATFLVTGYRLHLVHRFQNFRDFLSDLKDFRLDFRDFMIQWILGRISGNSGFLGFQVGFHGFLAEWES